MGFSLKVIFLGLLLNGQQWMSRGQNYHKPSISVTPSAVVALGRNVHIHCRSEGYNKLEFHLVKEVSASMKTLNTKTAEVDEVVFSIENAKRSDRGAYRCVYIFRSDGYQTWSDYSEAVHLNITETPKPRELMTAMWASGAAGLFLLLLLLSLIAFLLYRKKNKGSTVKERSKAVNMASQPEDEADATDVAYASLNHCSLKTEHAASPDRAPESCIYALLAEGRTQEGQ
ncbi:killer cell immunoglobulin-like receptor 3DL1 isoform X1 [Pogona vitticeps]